MKYEAHIYQMTVDDRTFWVADSKVLKGCTGQGETSEEAIRELEQNELDWIETASEVGIPIPGPTAHVPFVQKGKVALRLSPNVHADAVANAEELGVSLNHYLNDAIVSYNTSIKNFLRKPVTTPAKSDTREKVIQFPLKCLSSNPVIMCDERKEM